jgi:hypothetical protein
MVLGEGMRTTAAEVGLGMAGAFWLARAMASLLYGVTATDPSTFAGVPLLACYLRRGARGQAIVHAGGLSVRRRTWPDH